MIIKLKHIEIIFTYSNCLAVTVCNHFLLALSNQIILHELNLTRLGVYPIVA